MYRESFDVGYFAERKTHTHARANFVHLPDVRTGEAARSRDLSESKRSWITFCRKLKRRIIENKLCTVYFQFDIARCSPSSVIYHFARTLVHSDISISIWVDGFCKQAISSLSKRVFDIPFEQSISNHGWMEENRAQIKSKTTILSWWTKLPGKQRLVKGEWAYSLFSIFIDRDRWSRKEIKPNCIFGSRLHVFEHIKQGMAKAKN